MYKRSAGELRAKLLSGEQDKQRTVTKVWPVCGTLRGKVGPGCGARGRRRGLAGLRDDAPSHRSETWPHWRGGRRRVRRARAGFEIDHSEPPGSRVAISRAAGPDGARNTSGAASDKLNRAFQPRRRCGGRRRVRRARAGFEIDHSERSSRVAISRAAGPDGARNTSGATSTTERRSLRTPRSTPGSGRPGGRRGARAR